MENMVKEQFVKATGALQVVLKDEFGNIKEERHIPNLVVTVGKNFIASRMVGTASAVMSHMAVGTSATTPAVANTALGAEVGRVALASSTASGNVITYKADFPAGTGTGALTEAGILNAATNGTLLCRAVFSVVNKAAADTLSITWNVTIN